MQGKKIGKWTVLEQVGHDKNRMRLWRCRCDCGYERSFGTAYLNTGQPTCCPDCRRSLRGVSEQEVIRHYVGKQVGGYTVLRLEGRTKYGSREWLCRCRCGYERLFPTSFLSGNGRRHATQCPDCTLEALVLQNRTVTELPHRFWKRLVDQAKRRKIQVKVTQEQAAELFHSQGGKCALSGVPLHFTNLRTNFNRYTTASLDRIDSTIPYQEGNIQWVHKEVNMMKGRLSPTVFKEWCCRIAGEG